MEVADGWRWGAGVERVALAGRLFAGQLVVARCRRVENSRGRLLGLLAADLFALILAHWLSCCKPSPDLDIRS